MSGDWVTLDRPLYETEILACSACGAMVAGRGWWTASPEGRLLCGPECEQLEVRVSELRERYRSDGRQFASLNMEP